MYVVTSISQQMFLFKLFITHFSVCSRNDFRRNLCMVATVYGYLPVMHTPCLNVSGVWMLEM